MLLDGFCYNKIPSLISTFIGLLHLKMLRYCWVEPSTTSRPIMVVTRVVCGLNWCWAVHVVSISKFDVCLKSWSDTIRLDYNMPQIKLKTITHNQAEVFYSPFELQPKSRSLKRLVSIWLLLRQCPWWYWNRRTERWFQFHL